jgi:hypothetical protein
VRQHGSLLYNGRTWSGDGVGRRLSEKCRVDRPSGLMSPPDGDCVWSNIM